MKYTKIRQRGENKVDINHSKAVIEAILFSAGRTVEKKELLLALEINENDLDTIILNMQDLGFLCACLLQIFLRRHTVPAHV